MKTKILAGIVVLSVVAAAILFVVNPAAPQSQAEDPQAAEPRIREYFGNLTGAQRGKYGVITALEFEDGRVFRVDKPIRLSGWNIYYNVTYLEPDKLISIQEFVEGWGFQGGD